MRIGILTISTSLARGERPDDASGDAIAAFVAGPDLAATVTQRATVADDRTAIRDTLIAWADSGACDVILTTGGTGFAPSDVTPEATADAIERAAPGLAEAMRAGTAVQTPLAWLSRSTAASAWRFSRPFCLTRWISSPAGCASTASRARRQLNITQRKMTRPG